MLATQDRPPPVDAAPTPASIGDVIAHWASVQPDAPALLGGDATVSWRQLHGQVGAIGRSLAGFGLRPGHRVGLLVPEGLRGGLLVLGVCCHCVLVPLNPALTSAELAQSAEQLLLDAIVVPPAGLERLDPGGFAHTLVLEDCGDASVLDVRLRAAREASTRPARPAAASLAGVAALLRSSGTTGTPKLVPVSHANLLAMAAKLASPEWLGLGTADRSIANLPLHYAAGLKTLLLVPLLVGGSVGFPRTGHGMHLGEWLRELQPTYLNTTPATLRALLDHAAAGVRGSTLRFVMCGASYLPDDLRQAATTAFELPVIEYYGLSEAGIVASNPLPPRAAKPGSVGRPWPGELRIVDTAGDAVPPGQPGEIEVRGPGVCAGYVLADGSLSGAASDGALRTGDMGRLDEDGFLWILGRAKEVINRGGEKVFPYEVEKALLEHGDVLEAAVYGVPHARLGEGVAAAVVPRPGREPAPRELARWLAGRLAPFKVPRSVRVVPELPRGASGKVLRRELSAQHQATRAAPGVVDSLLQEELLGLWQRLLGRDDVGVDDDFLDAGGDSLLAADLLLEVERLTGASTQGWDLSSLTVNDVARAVLRTHAEGSPPTGTLLSQVRAGTGAPLVFCHGDIASRGIYAHRLVEVLPSQHPVWLLDSPASHAGLGIEAAAQAGLDEVLAVVRTLPFPRVYLAGWCNAGLVAWHLAHLLRERGVRVHALLLIDTPSLNAGGGLRHAARVLRHAGARLPGPAGRFLREDAMRGLWALARKGLPRFAEAVARHATVGEGPAPGAWVPDDLHRRGIQYYKRISRYVPPRLDVPVTCLLAEDGATGDTDPARWRGLAPEVRVVRIPGSHYSSVVGHRATLGARMAECMQRPAGAIGA